MRLDSISLRYRDRALLIGMSREGKSTLAKFLLLNYSRDMAKLRTIPDTNTPALVIKGKRVTPRVLVIDTKPRWRGTSTVTGKSTASLYRKMVPGDLLPATILTKLSDWNLAWDSQLNPTGMVISQNLDLEDAQLVRYQVQVMQRFLATQDYRQPSLVYIDEGHDFFGGNATARYGTIIQRGFRAGAEQGMSSLLGMQRPKTVNLQTLTESNILYLFHIKFTEDLKRLAEMGLTIRPDQVPEEESHRFLYGRASKLYPKQMTLVGLRGKAA